MRDVELFAEQRGLQEHLHLLKQGALVAQNPPAAHLIDGDLKLSEDQLFALEREVKHKWQMPWKLFLTIALCSIGAATQGWDQEGINGANLFFPAYYGIPTKNSPHATRNQILMGLVNSGPYLGSAVWGCWLADPLNNYLGRRSTIFIAGHFLIWPTIGSSFCHNWWSQFICRLLMGIGMGLKAATVPVYAAENSPAPIRGALVMTWQFWTAFGIMLGTAVNLALFNVRQPLNWKLMLGAPFIPAVPLVIFIYMCPESPRWLMKKDRYAEAWVSMRKLRFNEITVARDIYYISAQLEIEHLMMGDNTWIQRMWELFTIPRVRRATLAAFTVMLAQQLCGINIIAFFSTDIFVKAGLSQFTANIGSFGFGMTNWLFCFPAFWTIDTFGRRGLLLFTFPQMFWTLLAAGLCTLIPISAGTARTGAICLFVFLFAAFYSPGEGPVPFAYSAEVFPLSHRETGMGFAVATCLGWAAVLSITLPFMLSKIHSIVSLLHNFSAPLSVCRSQAAKDGKGRAGPTQGSLIDTNEPRLQGVFGFYAGMNIVALIMIFFFVPETMQRTLEELDWVFAVPTGKFIRYQVTKAVPYFCRRWILFDRSAKLAPLYHFDHISSTTKDNEGYNNMDEGVLTDEEKRVQ